MPYSEFVEHVAYHRLFPWGDDWAQAATVAHAAVQPHIKKQLSPSDFIPKPRSKPQSPEQMLGFFKGLAAMQQAAKEKKNAKHQ